MEQAAFSDALPPQLDLLLICLKADEQAHRFFRTLKPDRLEDVNVVRFTVGGFLFFLKIDQRAVPNVGLAETWIRNREEIVCPILPLLNFEEGKFLREAWQNEGLSEFLKNAGRS